MAERLNGAQILCESLRREGVGDIFGFPGGSVLPFYAALPQYPDLRHILVRHEQGAGFAADGYARASGKVGVCLATSGPGATNLVTAIACGRMDSSPIVAITGQVLSGSIGSDAFQESPITEIVRSITKHCYQVGNTKELASIVHEAFYIARTGRPGPVLIDIPRDVFTGESEFKYPDQEPDIPGYWPKEMNREHRLRNMREKVRAAIEEIKRSKSPIILAGNGINASHAHGELLELAEKIQAPVASTLLGLSAFLQDNPLALGMLGMHGTFLANTAVSNADLIIAIGMRFDDRATGKLKEFASNARVIHIDIDPAEIGKNVEAHVPICGDAKIILQYLNSMVSNEIHPEWLSKIAEWRRDHPTHQIRESEHLLPQYCIKRIGDITGGMANIVTGVGQHQMWAAQYFLLKRLNSFFSSGGSGPMGFGLPAGIGVQVAWPGEQVWVIDGDGSFQMSMQELGTVIQEKLPLKIAIINNGFLGMVRQWQELFYKKRYVGTPLLNPDFITLAAAYRIPALRVTEKSMVDSAIQQAMDHDGPYLIDFVVEPEENVFPMVPPGASLAQMLESFQEEVKVL